MGKSLFVSVQFYRSVLCYIYAGLPVAEPILFQNKGWVPHPLCVFCTWMGSSPLILAGLLLARHNSGEAFRTAQPLESARHTACDSRVASNLAVNIFAPAAAARAHHSLLPHWLIHLGAPGVFALAIVDSSIIPLPLPGSTDVLLLVLVSHSGNPWLLTACAIAGSIVGGYTTWQLGKKGGEAAMKRWMSARMLKRVNAWVADHPVLAVFLPAVLPPPIPLSPFILASGALGVSRGRFLAAYSAARILRYSLVSWLAVRYGRHVVRLWNQELGTWSAPLLWMFGAVAVAGLGYGIWKFRQIRRTDATNPLNLESEPAR